MTDFPFITYVDLITKKPTIGFPEVRPQVHYLGASITKTPQGYRVYSGEGEFFASYNWADSFKEAWLEVCLAAPSWPDPGYRMETHCLSSLCSAEAQSVIEAINNSTISTRLATPD